VKEFTNKDITKIHYSTSSSCRTSRKTTDFTSVTNYIWIM